MNIQNDEALKEDAEGLVDAWLAECTDGRVSSHTITMLRTFSRWLAFQKPPSSGEAMAELVNTIGDCCDELHISQVNQLARAILPIIHAREAAAKADAERLVEVLKEAADFIQPFNRAEELLDRIDAAIAKATGERV